MSFIPALFITTVIIVAALFSIIGHSKHAKLAERQEAAISRSLFIQDFPILWWTTLLTIFIEILFFLICFSKYNVETLMDKELVLTDQIIPFIIILAILLPTSIKNFSKASPELKYTKPYLFISVLLMTFFNSLTISIVFTNFISLILQK